jgi:hypothetical protein
LGVAEVGHPLQGLHIVLVGDGVEVKVASQLAVLASLAVGLHALIDKIFAICFFVELLDEFLLGDPDLDAGVD